MTTIALAFEFKQNGGIGRLGPGDALRLAHALKHPGFGDVKITLLTTISDRVAGLIQAERVHDVPMTATSGRTGLVNQAQLLELVQQYAGALTPDDRVVHAHIGSERSNPWSPTRLGAAVRQRIDATRLPHSKMFHRRLDLQTGGSAPTATLAVYIRSIEYDTTRNTPSWFVPLCERLTGELGVKLLWCGDTAGIENASRSPVLPATGSFLQQIHRIRESATLAVGWNSGGLDLAAAAGLPILRIGEFQRGGPSLESECERKRYNWGANYNSFLASAPNIGLAPEYICADLFPQATIEKSLRSFIAHPLSTTPPCHVILPPGVALDSDWEMARAQLHVHSTDWPVNI